MLMFDDYCLDKILNKEKTVTRRIICEYNDNDKDNVISALCSKRPGVPGKVHKLKIDRSKDVYGYIEILSCDYERFDDITFDEVLKEGFDSLDDYKNYFMNVNNVDNTDYLVWRVEFRLI